MKMLKFLFPAIFFLFYTGNVSAQDLPTDELGKITYHQVVKVDSMPAQQLLRNAEEWVRKVYVATEKSIVKDTGGISVKGYYKVYTRGGVSKEVHGAIRYNLRIEVKDSKYKYTFTDFVFEYYKINRNYQYVPTGKTKPLEDKNFPGWQAAWENHKKETHQKISYLIESLKSAMAKRDKTKQKKENKEDW